MLLNFIIYNMYNLYLHVFFLNFLIWNIKILNIFFNFSELTNETWDPASWPGQLPDRV
jgi:hypothetical protein